MSGGRYYLFLTLKGGETQKAENNYQKWVYFLFWSFVYWFPELIMASMYCVKCREKREVDNPEQVTMKNGKKALRGTCPVCGTKMFKIGG